MASKIDVLALNRVVGLGLIEPATEEYIDQIIEWFASAGVPRFFVQVSPGAEPDALTGWLTGRSFRPHNNWVRLCRGTQPPPEVITGLLVEQIDRRYAADFGKILAQGFGWPESAGLWWAQTVERPGWHHYLAFDENLPVATGAFFVSEKAAWFSAASTLPGHRGKGAQNALLARRIQDALLLGCTTFSVETAQPTSERDAPSWRNVQRMGFQECYVRPNYLLKTV
jgi:GNAT superfamily N-acetyltransferase